MARERGLSKTGLIRKNLLDLEHQHLINFVNIAIIGEVALLIALWVGSFSADARTKVEWSLYSLGLLSLLLFWLYRQREKLKTEISRL